MGPADIRWVFVALAVTLGTIAGLGLDLPIAKAESIQGRGSELLSRAEKSYQAGSYSEAAEAIDSAFKAGLTGEMAARAILLRAEIGERSGALAKALQDYSNALWMESLRPADQKKASEGKQRVLAAMGLSPSGAPAATQVSASAAPAQSGGSSSGVLSFITSVFQAPENKPAPPPVAPPPSAQPAVPASPQPVTASASQPKPSHPAPKPAKVANAKPAAPAQASAQPSSALAVTAVPGEALIVFGSASSEASGRSTASAIKAKLSDILINRNLDITPKANGGFQIQAGPYQKKASAIALCNAIQQRGISCQVTP